MPNDQPFWPPADYATFRETHLPVLQVSYPQVPGAEYIGDDQLCLTCHETYVRTFAHNIHLQQGCEDCHGPASRHVATRGKEPGLILNFKKLKKAERSEICLKCHQNNQCGPGGSWRTSVHAHSGVSCTDCHTAHYNVPSGGNPVDGANTETESPIRQAGLDQFSETAHIDLSALRAQSMNLGAITPEVCYRCHSGMKRFETLAHPHQMLGPNAFTCETCHDPHGNVRPETRTDLCLNCHQGAPTMAWHSSIHSINGVACTDCHNPHPDSYVQQTVNIYHTHISREKRLPMAVEEPMVCYRCHPQTYAKTSMPSHHPIKEGKMVCSDCHDSHGQEEGNLKEETVNMVCYRCHAEKQGPFVYEHPPATENCMICHEPHGTVSNNLLRQPTTFLCLRCHSGHRVGPSFGAHAFAGVPDVGTDVEMQRAFYTDCTQCHAQVHGSDLPSPHDPHSLLR